MAQIPHLPPPDYNEHLRRVRLAYLDFSEHDQRMLRELEILLEGHLDEIVNRFYRHLLSLEETRRVFRDEAMVERLKQAQLVYLRATLRGPYDAHYFESRWVIGYVHNLIKLEPQWFVGAFQLYHRILYPLILKHYRNEPEAAVDHLLALDKIMNLDEQLGLESYMAHYMATMEQLEQFNIRLQEASTAKSQFLANISHEFRTPLNVILGFAEVLQDEVAGPLNEEQHECLSEVRKAGNLLLRLISDVLDVSRLETDHLDLFYETFPVGQAIRESVTPFREEAERKGLRLEADIPPDLGVIEADQIRFKQIFHNLLSNALKFTDRGIITVSASVEGGRLHFKVADTGVGIAEKDHEQVFTEFSQVDASHRRKYEGTGLGLALTRRLVDLHGGAIWFDSEPGRGSVFHVVLPPRKTGRKK